MAVKIIEKENGEVVTKSSRQVRKEKLIAKAKKYIFVSLAVTMLMSCSLVVFAAPTAPSGVDTATMGTLADIVWWIVRIAILAVGGIPAIVKIVQGQADENSRDRNAGIATLLIAAAGFGATFAIDSAIGI